MPVLTRCSACRVTIKAPSRFAGRQIACPKCAADVVIDPRHRPAGGTSPELPRMAGSDTVVEDAPVRPKARPASEGEIVLRDLLAAEEELRLAARRRTRSKLILAAAVGLGAAALFALIRAAAN